MDGENREKERVRREKSNMDRLREQEGGERNS